MNKILVKTRSLDGLISTPQFMGEGTIKYNIVSPNISSSRTHSRSVWSQGYFKKVSMSQLTKHFSNVQSGDTVIIENKLDLLAHYWDAVSDRPAGNHNPLISLSAMRSLYDALIDGIRSLEAAPVLLSLTPVDPVRYLNYVSNGRDRENIRRWTGWNLNTFCQMHELYNRELFSLAEEKQNPVVNLSKLYSDDFVSSDCLLDDGYSLSPKGQSLVDEVISSIRL